MTTLKFNNYQEAVKAYKAAHDKLEDRFFLFDEVELKRKPRTDQVQNIGLFQKLHQELWEEYKPELDRLSNQNLGGENK